MLLSHNIIDLLRFFSLGIGYLKFLFVVMSVELYLDPVFCLRCFLHLIWCHFHKSLKQTIGQSNLK